MCEGGVAVWERFSASNQKLLRLRPASRQGALVSSDEGRGACGPLTSPLQLYGEKGELAEKLVVSYFGCVLRVS